MTCTRERKQGTKIRYEDLAQSFSDVHTSKRGVEPPPVRKMTHTNTYFLGPKTESHFLAFWIDLKDTIFDFVSPQQLFSFQVFHAIVRRDELTNASLSNVLEIFLGLIKGLGDTNSEKSVKKKERGIDV